MAVAGIGHNSEDSDLEVEVRLFNALAGRKSRTPDGSGRGGGRMAGGRMAGSRMAGGRMTGGRMTVASGTTVGDIANRLGLRADAIHLVLVNGRDITGGCVGDPVRRTYAVEQGDVIAFSGPVPYSYGYGAPVV